MIKIVPCHSSLLPAQHQTLIAPRCLCELFATDRDQHQSGSASSKVTAFLALAQGHLVVCPRPAGRAF
jgi:hypothetical protein